MSGDQTRIADHGYRRLDLILSIQDLSEGDHTVVPGENGKQFEHGIVTEFRANTTLFMFSHLVPREQPPMGILRVKADVREDRIDFSGTPVYRVSYRRDDVPMPPADDVVRAARERRWDPNMHYHSETYNDEHFATKCKTGTAYSYQVTP